MTALTIRADELITAFEDQSPEMQHYFDRETGEVLTVFLEKVEEMDFEEEERLEGDPCRYLRIEPVPSRTGFEIISDFVDTLPEGRIQRELDQALGKNRPFRRFKDVLRNYPEVEDDWYRFHEKAYMKIIKEWLDDHGVEATLVPLQA